MAYLNFAIPCNIASFFTSKKQRKSCFLLQDSEIHDRKLQRIPMRVGLLCNSYSVLRYIVRRHHTMLDASEEHRRAFKEQPLVVFRRAPNLKDSLVRAKLPMSQTRITKGCFKCGKSHCQVCSSISESSSFSGNVSGKQYSISSSFNCESSGSVYLLGCKACGRQYVGSTFTSLRTRFNN